MTSQKSKDSYGRWLWVMIVSLLILPTIPIVSAIVTTAVGTEFGGFYFTLLYRYPHGELYQTASSVLFTFGFMISAMLLAITYCIEATKTGSISLMIGGWIIVISMIAIISVPGGINLHGWISSISVLLSWIYMGIRLLVCFYQRRRVSTGTLGILFTLSGILIVTTGILYLFSYYEVVWATDLLFSLSQIPLGGVLFLGTIVPFISTAIN